MNSLHYKRRYRVETLEPLVLMSASAIEADGEDPQVVQSASPIVIDLNDDGRIGVTGETTAKDKSGTTSIGETIAFDIDGDGELEQIEWVDGSGDGILIDTSNLDPDNVTGANLFGDEGGRYANGYEKLKAFDLDGNKLVEADEFAGLKLWVDDGDGQLESGELQELADHDIYSISLRVNHGKGLIRSWAYTEYDERLMTEDVWFAIDQGTDPASQETEVNQPPVAVDDEAAVFSGESVVVDLMDNDIDSDGEPLTVIGHTRAEYGIAELNSNNTLTYTAPEDFVGVVYVQYTISDGKDVSIATVRIDVLPRPAANNLIASAAQTRATTTAPDDFLVGYDTDDSDEDVSEKSKSDKSHKSEKSVSAKSEKSKSAKSEKSKSEKSEKTKSEKTKSEKTKTEKSAK